MIIWINGTFGSGKTTTAYELHRRLKKSFVYDPEKFGYVFMANVPKEIAKSDFQHYPLWREANFSLLKDIAENYNGILIVPMTLTNEQYYEEIIGRLGESNIVVKHFTLAASQSTVKKRLRKRFEGKRSWAYQQIDSRIKDLSKPVFREQIQTDGMSIDEVVERIAELSNIELLPDNRSRIQKLLNRISVKIKQMSFFKWIN